MGERAKATGQHPARRLQPGAGAKWTLAPGIAANDGAAPPAFLEDMDEEGSAWGWDDWDGVDWNELRWQLHRQRLGAGPE